MKLRNGFVSNSSSSSFLIYGTSVDRDKVEELEAKAEELGMTVEYGHPDGYYGYIGLSWDAIQDSETGAQFKNKIEEAVKKLLGPETKCMTHTQSWYNG